MMAAVKFTPVHETGAGVELGFEVGVGVTLEVGVGVGAGVCE